MSNEMSRRVRPKNIQTRLEASYQVGFAVHFLVSKAVPAKEKKEKEKHIMRGWRWTELGIERWFWSLNQIRHRVHFEMDAAQTGFKSSNKFKNDLLKIYSRHIDFLNTIQSLSL